MLPTSQCYKAAPLKHVDGIPVFSARNFYVENYERIASDHLSHLEKTGDNPFIPKEHWAEIERSTEALIRKYAPAGCRILDVGVGLGRLLARRPDLQRFGMDISMGYLQRARAEGIDVCLSLIEDMPYRDGFFDVVVTTDVLEHVLDLNQAFDKILRVLKPGGILIVRVPYREDLSGYLDPAYPYHLVHLRNFDEHSIRLLVEKVFNREFVEYTLTGFVIGGLKWNVRVRGVRRLVRNAIALARHLGEEKRVRLASWCNRPLEINFVVKNDEVRKR